MTREETKRVQQLLEKHTRKDTAKRLGCSLSTVNRMVAAMAAAGWTVPPGPKGQHGHRRGWADVPAPEGGAK